MLGLADPEHIDFSHRSAA